MVSVILIWLYMLFTCYVTGYAFVKAVAGKSSGCAESTACFRCKKEISYVYAGVGIVTVYAQIFSIFCKVGLGANLFLLVLCFICLAAYRRDFGEKIRTFRLTVTPGKVILAVMIFLLFAYGTSAGVLHYDTGLYHAQSIRWIEEYGAVPGLGNLHSRLAYNSSAFCLSALYGMAFLGGQSYHCCAGFLAFLLALVCGEAFRKNRIRKPHLSDFIRLAGIYYLFMIFDEMISPASDYFMVLLVFYIMIRWAELTEESEASYLPYGLLSLLCVVVVTVKLSGALILLLALKPAYMLVRQRRGKEILKFLGTGALALAPFLIRNVILSGWLVYPFTFIDLFDFDFKIPKGMADYDAKEIQVYGRGFTDVSRYEDPPSVWLPEWVRALDSSNRVFLLLALSGLVLLAGFGIYALVKRKREAAGFYHMAVTAAVCFVFWLLSAPLIRYGCVFLWLTAVLPWGYLYLKISPHLDRFRIYMILLAVFGGYKLGIFCVEAGSMASGQYLIAQKDYENFDTVSYPLHGYLFYYPREGDRTGYTDFPASPVKAEDIFRGNTIEEGFRDVIHQRK